MRIENSQVKRPNHFKKIGHKNVMKMETRMLQFEADWPLNYINTAIMDDVNALINLAKLKAIKKASMPKVWFDSECMTTKFKLWFYVEIDGTKNEN